jgi:hypothetical protein
MAADKEKDRLRKAAQRAQPKSEPAPLPSANALAGPGNPAQAPAGGVVLDAGAEGAPFIPWQSQMLQPLFDQLVPAAEEMMAAQLSSKAAKAKLPADMVKQIETDAAWSPPSKKAVQMSAPEVAAKWLNEAGVSSEHRGEIVLGLAVLQIGARHVQLVRSLDKLIAQNAEQKKPEEKKP